MKPPYHHNSKKGFQLERIILFSDAVFAIAITLLVIEIKIPELESGITESQLLHKMDHLIPKFVGFIISFILIGVYWSIHHRLFGFVVNYSTRLIALNFLFLFTIVLMPFSTGIFGEYSAPSTIHLKTPLFIYVLNICLTGFTNFLLWNYAGNPRNGIAEGFPDEHYVAAAKRRALAVPSVFLVSAIVALVNPILARYVPLLLFPVMRIFRNGKKKTKSPDGPSDSHNAVS